MPAYEYHCESCAARFERRQKMSEPAVELCPKCGGPVKRLISAGAGVISKGAAGYSATPRACQAGDACCAPQMDCGNGMCGCGM
jgi:putative FmdB family regulatory protein